MSDEKTPYDLSGSNHSFPMSTNKIVADGRERAYDGSIQQVRAEIEAQYAEELRKAGFWKRILLQRRIEREIRDRMKEIAPPDGLY